MVCKNCGMANSDTAQVCSECGSVLRAEKPQPKPQSNLPQGAIAPQAVMPAQGFAVVQAPYAVPVQWYAPPAAPAVYTAPAYNMPLSPPQQPYAAAPVPPAAAPPVQEVQESAQPEQPPQLPAAQEQAQAPATPAFTEPMPAAPPVGQLPMMPPAPYMQPGVYPYGYSSLMKDPHAAKATWALVLGIVATALPLVSCSMASPLTLIAGIAAIILGAIALNRVRPESKGKAIGGLVMGIVGTVISLIGIIFMVLLLSGVTETQEWQSFYDQYNSFIAKVIVNVMSVVMITVKSIISKFEILMRFMFMS